MRSVDAQERVLESVDQRRTSDRIMTDAQDTSSSAETSRPAEVSCNSNPNSNWARRSKDDKKRFIRWFFEQSLRDELQQGALEGAMAAYKEVTNSDNIAADVMEQLRARARVTRQSHLPAFAEEFLEEVVYDYVSSSDDDV